MREVNGGVSDESARTSLKRGASPSRFAVLEMGRDSKLAAKERAAAMERSPDHRVTKAATQAARWVTAALRAKQADEGGSFGTPATTDFKTEHNQGAPTGVGELRVGTLFCPACFSQRSSSGAASPAPGHTGRSKRRDKCSVNGQLRASPQRQAIGDHLDAALIMTVCLEVQVSHQDVCGDSGTSLTADPGSCTFERSTPCPENTRPGAGSDVVTNSIKRTPTAASCRSKW